MKFYDEIKSHSPFFIRELAIKISKSKEKKDIDKIYKKIYMQIRYYHQDDWNCEPTDNGNKGRLPLMCTYIGGKK